MKSYLILALSIYLSVVTARADSRPEISTELLRQIQSDFLQLSQPLNFVIQARDSWSGIDALQRGFGVQPASVKVVVLKGDTLEFQEKYPAGAIAIALYPYLKDHDHDAEACIILYAVMNEKLPIDFTSFRSRNEPGDWASVANKEVRLARSSASNLGMHSYHWSVTRTAYKVKREEMLPYSLKKKSSMGSWFSRLFR